MKTAATFTRAAQCVTLIVAASMLSLVAQTQTTSDSLPLVKTIALPGVTGKFDHFAFDPAGKHLFIAATGNHSVEVIDLKSGTVNQSITGLGKPHGLEWNAATESLYVADGALGELRVYRGAPLKLAGSIKLSNDADDMVYNKATHMLYVGHGGSGAIPGRVAVVDTTSFSMVENIPVASHPEALDLDVGSRRIFANIAESGEVAVIDGTTSTIVAHWKLNGASDNVPIAFDSVHGRLFIACRAPATLLMLDAATGTELARAPTGAGADDLFYDAALNRVYVISGAGEIDAYQADGKEKIAAVGVTHTLAGAKTALFVLSESALYVGVPAVGEHGAEIRVYSTSTKGKTSAEISGR